jgi:succinyl-diaminopimelate desuccinylase
MMEDNEMIDFCLVGEPTSSVKVADCARIGRRGSLGGHLKILGKQGHIAYPEKVINPILQSGDLISKLNEKVWDNGNDAFDPTSFQISNINAGTGAHNVVPGELELTFNFRFSTESTEKSLKSQFESILDELKLNYELSWDLNGTPYYTEESFFKDVVCCSTKEVTGYIPELNAKGGTSDGRFVAKMDTEIIELGPVNSSIHQIDEHIKISELWVLKDIYKNILVNLNQAL